MTACIEVQIRDGAPPDPAAWDALALRSGNLVQSTSFDRVQEFFGLRPVYFAATDGRGLCGGVKLYGPATRSAIAWRLTSSFVQLGEALAPEATGPPQTHILDALGRSVARHLDSAGAVLLRVSGLYGGMDSLIALASPPRAVSRFNVASLDLSRTVDALWVAVHKTHRAEIRKAERNGVTLSRDDSIERFIALLDATYRGQDRLGPDRDYVRHAYRALKDRAAELFFAVRGSDDLAGALCFAWGPVAYYQFGGTVRTNLGAGAYLHWRVMNAYKERGIPRYLLGQVAAGEDPSNPRFVVGISRFKRRFGPIETPSASSLYVLRPWRRAIGVGLAALKARIRRTGTWTTRR